MELIDNGCVELNYPTLLTTMHIMPTQQYEKNFELKFVLYLIQFTDLNNINHILRWSFEPHIFSKCAIKVKLSIRCNIPLTYAFYDSGITAPI